MYRPDYTGSQLGQMRSFKVYAFGFPSHKGRTFLNQLNYYQLLKEDRKPHYGYLKLNQCLTCVICLIYLNLLR